MSILPNQKVLMRWNNRNKTSYINKGYAYTKSGDEFEVNLEDLNKGSQAMIKVKCDYCEVIFKKKYSSVLNTKNHFCKKLCHNNFMVGKEGNRTSEWANLKCYCCNKEFERPKYAMRDGRQFCSKKCSNITQKEDNCLKGRLIAKRFKINCKYCNKEMLRTQVEIDRAENNFCDHECASNFVKGKKLEERRTGEKVKCANCHAEIYRPPYRIKEYENHYCNKKCYAEWMIKSDNLKTRPKTGKNVECSTCKKEMYRKNIDIINSKTNKFYCSRECKNIDVNNWNLPQTQKGKTITVECYHCGKEKEVLPSVYNKNKYFFCNHECYHHKRLEISDFKGTLTTPHVRVNNLLDDLNIVYTNEKQFWYYSIDIYLNESDLLIEVMGDYWHANPLKYTDESQLYERQVKDIKTDKRKNKYITKNLNKRILYLWENDILENEDLCKNLIELFIENDGHLLDYNSYNYFLNDETIILNECIIDPYFLRG